MKLCNLCDIYFVKIFYIIPLTKKVKIDQLQVLIDRLYGISSKLDLRVNGGKTKQMNIGHQISELTGVKIHSHSVEEVESSIHLEIDSSVRKMVD